MPLKHGRLPNFEFIAGDTLQVDNCPSLFRSLNLLSGNGQSRSLCYSDRPSLSCLNSLPTEKSFALRQICAMHSRGLNGFKYAICANLKAKRMQCTKVCCRQGKVAAESEIFNRYYRNNMNLCSRFSCECWQDADFVTPVTDWRRRVFLETYGCLQQRPLQLIPGYTDFNT